VYLDQLNLFSTYPFSTTKRLEFSGGVTCTTTTELTRRALLPNGYITEARTVDAPAPPGVTLFQTSVAVVGDGSFFGFTSPIQGYRYRVEVEPTVGSLTYVTLLLDYRKYFRVKPVTLALRGMHLGRYGRMLRIPGSPISTWDTPPWSAATRPTPSTPSWSARRGSDMIVSNSIACGARGWWLRTWRCGSPSSAPISSA
jgi:hypothetical protein